MLSEVKVNKKLNLPFRERMEKLIYAFDVDGTLRNNSVDQTIAPVANEDIRTLLIILSKFKNIKIVVWSGSGELYARQIGSMFALDKYVWKYAAKSQHEEIKKFGRVIAIDDIQDTDIGDINAIVNQK